MHKRVATKVVCVGAETRAKSDYIFATDGCTLNSAGVDMYMQKKRMEQLNARKRKYGKSRNP